MENDKPSNLFKLEHRIYPAIQSCVANRYKIVAGLFSVYAFLVATPNLGERLKPDISFMAAIAFTFFVFFNSINYWYNAKEQYELEEGSSDTCKKACNFMRVEGLFLIGMLITIWLGYCYWL